MGMYHAEVPSRDVAAFSGFAVQAKPVRFVSAGASALHTVSFLVLIQGTRRERKGQEFDLLPTYYPFLTYRPIDTHWRAKHLNQMPLNFSGLTTVLEPQLF